MSDMHVIGWEVVHREFDGHHDRACEYFGLTATADYATIGYASRYFNGNEEK